MNKEKHDPMTVARWMSNQKVVHRKEKLLSRGRNGWRAPCHSGVSWRGGALVKAGSESLGHNEFEGS